MGRNTATHEPEPSGHIGRHQLDKNKHPCDLESHWEKIDPPDYHLRVFHVPNIAKFNQNAMKHFESATTDLIPKLSANLIATLPNLHGYYLSDSKFSETRINARYLPWHESSTIC